MHTEMKMKKLCQTFVRKKKGDRLEGELRQQAQIDRLTTLIEEQSALVRQMRQTTQGAPVAINQATGEVAIQNCDGQVDIIHIHGQEVLRQPQVVTLPSYALSRVAKNDVMMKVLRAAALANACVA